ncbi:hypothetical protein AVEN_134217-1 [Araneus ventricosus]|uniref:Uncharacterized protein n=1 Tax=Araneus ventricosus TaxID=182803 RepID=A0A4Y2EQG4_ARAVE|nr:hypothetical protein AVEN_134217-1 [Araneus ventricosus]
MERSVAKKKNNSWTVSTCRKMSGPVQRSSCSSVQIPKNCNIKRKVKETYKKKTTVSPKKFTTVEQWTRKTTFSAKPAVKKASKPTSGYKPKPRKITSNTEKKVTVNYRPQITGFMFGHGNTMYF